MKLICSQFNLLIKFEFIIYIRSKRQNHTGTGISELLKICDLFGHWAIITCAILANVGSNDSKSKGKSRMLEYDNGARVEYENIDSDASWETDSDIVVAEKFSSVNNTPKNSPPAAKSDSIAVKPPSNNNRPRIRMRQKLLNIKTGAMVKCKICGAKMKHLGTTLKCHINCVYAFFIK